METLSAMDSTPRIPVARLSSIITKMVGRELSELYPVRENVPGEVVFEVEDFTSINPKSTSAAVKDDVGSSRINTLQSAETAFAISTSHTDGRITYKGQEIKIAQPKDAINSGIAMLTEDRRAPINPVTRPSHITIMRSDIPISSLISEDIMIILLLSFGYDAAEPGLFYTYAALDAGYSMAGSAYCCYGYHGLLWRR